MLLLAPSSFTAILYATVSAAALVQCVVASSSSSSIHQPRSPGSRNHQQLAKHAHSKRGEHYGKATFYNAETGNQGACGGYIKNSDWVVAIKGSMYGDYGRKSWWCEKRITITANGKTARNVRVGDACPGCPEGESLDMTPGLFAYFDNPDKGVIPIQWHLTSEDGQQDDGKKDEDEDKKDDKKNDWKPLDPVSSIWKAPVSWSPPAPSPSSKKVEEQKWTPPSSSPSSSQQWTATSSAQRQSSSSTSRNSTWPASATASSLSATTTFSASNSTLLAANVTISNSTDLNGRLRGNNTAVLPSSPGGLPPARIAGSKGSFRNKQSGGNLHRNAQIVLDLAGLAYAASRSH
ncbi:hypothetical protein P389DRAFT_98954 [Cystobasidium minutum MCA 4210]|uniref:uncharacterized protein n=1 Tax=Cystobasidium minutum MCA 4210 TaxID=1397322 RepID=UPI0034CE8BE4|eukprot:jgi/Rhomi1/98954/CE98953_642